MPQKKLNESHYCGKVSDTLVEINGRKVKCCRADLITASEYFDTALSKCTSGWTFRAVIPRGVMSTDTFEDVLKFQRSPAKVKITSENVFDLLKAADFLKLRDNKLEEACVFFIEKKLPIRQNMWHVLDFARTTKRERAYYHIVNYISLHLRDFISDTDEDSLETSQFLQLPFDDIKTILDLSPLDEETVVKTIMRWINHDVEKRWPYLKQLSCLGMMAPVPLTEPKCTAQSSAPARVDSLPDKVPISALDMVSRTASDDKPLLVFWRMKTVDPTWEKGPVANIIEVTVGRSITSELLETGSNICGMRRVAFDKSCVYSLNIVRGGEKDRNIEFQFFRHTPDATERLTSPSTRRLDTFEYKGYQLCKLEKRDKRKMIYMCKNDAKFLYEYNPDTDQWKTYLQPSLYWGAMAANELDKRLYFLCGAQDGVGYVFYFVDTAGIFLQLNSTSTTYTYNRGVTMNALNGRLYVYNESQRVYEIYDIEKEVWSLSSQNPYISSPPTERAVAYGNELWLFSAEIRRRRYHFLGNPTVDDEQMKAYMVYLYKPAKDLWRKYPLLRPVLEPYEKYDNCPIIASYLLDAISI